MKSWAETMNEFGKDKNTCTVNMLGKEEIEVCIGDAEKTCITDIMAISHLIGLVNINAKIYEDGECYIRTVKGLNEDGLIWLGDSWSSGRSQGYYKDQINEIYTDHDYTAGYDFIRLRKEEQVDNLYPLYIHILETNEVYPVTEIDDIEIRYCKGKFSFKYAKDKFELLAYVGAISHCYMNCKEEDFIGRYFISERSFITGAKLRKCIKCGYAYNDIKVYYEDYDYIGDNFKQEKKGISSLVSTSYENCRWLDIVDESIASKGNKDSEGRSILKPIKTELNAMTHQISIENDSVITSKERACIEVVSGDTLTISSSNNSTLTLIADSQQPCIGVNTHTGMSYGRWSHPYPCELKEIVLDNVNLVLESKVQNFSIGSYNNKEYPKITLMNGATIKGCPEFEGERVLVQKATPPEGSTKISGVPEYVILAEGESIEDEKFLSEELINIKAELNCINSKYAELITVKTSVSLAKEAVKLLKLNSELDITSLLIDADKIKTDYVAVGTIVLNMPAESAFSREIFYEHDKLEFLKKKYAEFVDATIKDDVKCIAKIARQIYGNKPFDELTDWDKKYIYEMIPAYQFDFVRDEIADARKFYEIE